MRVPIFHDGKPANLQAAILDAEFWLRWLRNRLNGPQPPSKEWNEYRDHLHLAIKTLQVFLPDDDDSGNASPPPPSRAPFDPSINSRRGSGDTKAQDRLRGGTIKARYCKVCSCELDEFNLAKQGDHTCRKCKEAGIKEKLRARQRAMRATE